MTEIHVIANTHTTRHLRRTLMGIACQTRRADSVVLACDSDDTAIRDEAGAASAEFGLPLSVVLRRRHERIRYTQARNNAVRHLLTRDAAPDSNLVFLDGDCVLEPEGLARHEAAMRRVDFVIGWRHDLSEAQTEAFDEAALAAGRLPVEPTPEQRRALDRRHRRFRRQALLRRWGLTKSHKPRMLGGHHAMTLAAYRAINGNDETFQDWGTDDDDLSRRLYAAKFRSLVAVRDIVAFHLYHPTNAPGRMRDAPNFQRLDEAFTSRCTHGLENPLPQNEPVVTVFG